MHVGMVSPYHRLCVLCDNACGRYRDPCPYLHPCRSLLLPPGCLGKRGLKMLCLLQEGGVAAKCSRWARLNRTLALLFPVRFCVLPIEHACTCFHEVNANTAAVILAQGLLAVIQRSARTFTIDSSNGCENNPALGGEHREGSRKRGEVESMPGIRRVLARSAVSLSGTRGQVGWNRMRCRHDAER